MKKTVVFIFALFFHSLVIADWQVEQHVDAMTDEVVKKAIVKNELGHAFSIYKISKGGEVWGNFRLSDKAFEQVDWRKPPIYRIDKAEPTNLSKMKQIQEMGVGVKAYEWEPKWVNFLVWHGKQNEGLSTDLVHLMEGEQVVFRYFLSTGGYKDTSFTLKGAAPAISEAIDISSKIDPAAQQKSEEFKQAFLYESKLCQQNRSTFKACFTKVNECRKLADQDVDKFKSCMQ